MTILLMLGWWYSRGWLWALHSIADRLGKIGAVFAVSVLLRTWFSPWKQISSTATFRNFFQVAIDNTISRVIGGIIRTTMLLLALLWAIVTIVFGLLLVLIWPLLPFSLVILPLLALSGVTL